MYLSLCYIQKAYSTIDELIFKPKILRQVIIFIQNSVINYL